AFVRFADTIGRQNRDRAVVYLPPHSGGQPRGGQAGLGDSRRPTSAIRYCTAYFRRIRLPRRRGDCGDPPESGWKRAGVDCDCHGQPVLSLRHGESIDGYRSGRFHLWLGYRDDGESTRDGHGATEDEAWLLLGLFLP